MAGVEWLLETYECPERTLCDQEVLSDLFRTIVAGMGLKPVGESVWHRFPGAGGMTGFWLLQESHLAIHTFPEFRSACLNVFCCTERPPLDWESVLGGILKAQEVRVREYLRVYHK